MQNISLSQFNFDLQKSDLPKNIYAIQIEDIDNQTKHELIIEHDGYCPPICSDRDQSQLSEYLCNLESSLISQFKKSNLLKNYKLLLEVMTDKSGELYFISKTSN